MQIPTSTGIFIAFFSLLLVASGCSGNSDGTSASGQGGAAGAGGAAGTGGTTPDAPLATSCRQPMNCPVDGKDHSCCETLYIEGGTFLMGRSLNGSDQFPSVNVANELPEHDATVVPYFLDKFEVTVARFRKFFDQYDGSAPAVGAGAHPHVAGSGWKVEWSSQLPSNKAALEQELLTRTSLLSSWSLAPGATEDRPIQTSWAVAFAFCVWDGGRLPTEAEWEFAAAGGDENRLYPWGNTSYDGTQVVGCTTNLDCPPNYQSIDECTVTGNCVDNGGKGFAPIGSAPTGAGRWGHLDLAGGAWEWVYGGLQDYNTVAAGCDECVLIPTSGDRIARGGDGRLYLPADNYDNTVNWRAVTRRETGLSVTSAPEQGFRCARDIPSHQ